MKKLIPILSLVIGALCVQNCITRDEDIDTHNTSHNEISEQLIMRQDSAKLSEQIKDPQKDPPVRDGDNWRPNQII
ncbi:hypothetical protein SAMN06265171_105205 [Chryseobacterium rhizoplanae]|uniref:Uncharacterized protein n=1 Tax=Chryseobacterium rhizoplanae TaxID=1609531 RepID=A0A521DK90_9FLAO|nr:hypothetical protein [Chryseobacterium rhizoplanae]SMO72106.1 hypothetical protein SAMN06265171_105205 [Chryseobacterium rhizoplanae]